MISLAVISKRTSDPGDKQYLESFYRLWVETKRSVVRENFHSYSLD